MNRVMTLTKKADALLKQGDVLMVSGQRAEGKRLLRKCLRFRSMVRALKSTQK